MRISDWSSDVCSFDLAHGDVPDGVPILRSAGQAAVIAGIKPLSRAAGEGGRPASGEGPLPPRLPTPRPVPAAALLAAAPSSSGHCHQSRVMAPAPPPPTPPPLGSTFPPCQHAATPP